MWVLRYEFRLIIRTVRAHGRFGGFNASIYFLKIVSNPSLHGGARLWDGGADKSVENCLRRYDKQQVCTHDFFPIEQGYVPLNAEYAEARAGPFIKGDTLCIHITLFASINQRSPRSLLHTLEDIPCGCIALTHISVLKDMVNQQNV